MSRIRNLKAVFACVALAVAMSGCATMGRDSNAQAVWVRSDPPGADIKVRGQTVGQTPLYVLVPRIHSPKLVLSRDGVDKEVKLETRYRWQASFFSNLVFYIFAPVGWLVDLIDGRAWNPQDPPVVSFRKPGDKRDYTLPYPDAVAIAPPMASSLTISNAALPALQEAIEARKQKLNVDYSILPYDSTLSLFLKRGYDFDGQGGYDDQRMLFETLDADAVWLSTLKSTGAGLQLDAKLEDKRNRQKIDEVHLLLDTEPGFLARTYERGRHLFGLPNAVTVSLSSQEFRFDRGNYGSVLLTPIEAKEWWQQGLSYLNALSITSIPAYRAGRSGRWQFSLFPVVRVSRRELIARGPSDVDGQTFARWWVSLGYGPELGYQVNRSYFYVNVLFNEVWTEISWRYRGRISSTTSMSMQPSSEFGYLYSLNDVWSLRGFVNVTGENESAWQDALTQTSSSVFPYTGQAPGIANVTTVGVSVGFSFEPYIVRRYREKENAQALTPVR